MALRPNSQTILKLAGLGPGNVPYAQIVPVGMFGDDGGLFSDQSAGPATADKFITMGDLWNSVAAGQSEAQAPVSIPGVSPPVISGMDVPRGGSWVEPPQAPPPVVGGGSSVTVPPASSWWPDLGWLTEGGGGGIGGPTIDWSKLSDEDKIRLTQGQTKPIIERPTQSPLTNMVIAGANVAGDAINTGVHAGVDALSQAGSFVFDSQEEYDKKYGTPSGTDAPKVPAVDPKDVFGTNAGGGPGGLGTGVGGSGTDYTLDLGQRYIPPPPPTINAVQYPMPPAIPAPAPRPQMTPFDYQPFLDRLKQYEPKDLDRGQYMRERLLANLSRAFAAGAGGSGWSGGAGAIARFGAGFGTSQANTTDQFLEEQAQIDEMQRQFGIDSTQMEMQLKERAAQVLFQNQQAAWQSGEDVRQTQIQNQANSYEVLSKNIAAINEANQTNADRMYTYHTTVGQLTEDKILPNMGKGTIGIQHTDPTTGQTSITIHKYDDPNFGYSDDALDMMKKMKDIGILDGSPQMNAVKYGRVLQTNDRVGLQKLMAEEAIRGQYLEQLIPDEDALAEIKDQVSEDLTSRGIMPGSDAYEEQYDSALAALAALRFDVFQMPPEQLQALASTGNYGAAIIYGNYAKRIAEQGPMATNPNGGIK